MLSQRIYQIACGYEDANDCNSLKDDPIFKICADKIPSTDSPLASQPTMSRFENSISILYYSQINNINMNHKIKHKEYKVYHKVHKEIESLRSLRNTLRSLRLKIYFECNYT